MRSSKRQGCRSRPREAGHRRARAESTPSTISIGASPMRELRGVCTAIVTPFDERGALNLDALDPFLDFQRSKGIEGVVVAGTNGEGTSLSVDERKRLLEAVIARRRNLLVIAGTGAASVT